MSQKPNPVRAEFDGVVDGTDKSRLSHRADDGLYLLNLVVDWSWFVLSLQALSP